MAQGVALVLNAGIFCLSWAAEELEKTEALLNSDRVATVSVGHTTGSSKSFETGLFESCSGSEPGLIPRSHPTPSLACPTPEVNARKAPGCESTNSFGGSPINISEKLFCTEEKDIVSSSPLTGRGWDAILSPVKGSV